MTPNRLADTLGPFEIIAIGPVDNPLPVTGPCSRCGTTTTRYGPAGRPICDQCRAEIAEPRAPPRMPSQPDAHRSRYLVYDSTCLYDSPGGLWPPLYYS
jgi:hypothetical protein